MNLRCLFLKLTRSLLVKKLTSFGYEVNYLLGPKATQANILSALKDLGSKGKPNGGILVGLWGHGVRYEKEDYFCPYDIKMRNAKDNDGNELLATEPDPAMAVGVNRLFSAIQLCNSKHRIILADCCRNTPNAARGRGFGAELSSSQVPFDTALIYACKADEQAFEHEKWKHGAFTKALLDCLSEESTKPQISASSLFSPLEEKVDDLVSSVTKKKQSVSPRLDGNPKIFVKSLTPAKLKENNSKPVEPPTERSSVAPYTKSTPTKPLLLRYSGIQLNLIPKGTFEMGCSVAHARLLNKPPDNERARNVTVSEFYMGITEVTFGQFQQFCREAQYKTEAEIDPAGGGGYVSPAIQGNRRAVRFTWRHSGYQMAEDYPVVNVSWNDAVAFCKWLSRKEGITVRLPTEAEWEYACRGGTQTLYASGDEPSSLFRYANVRDRAFVSFVGNAPGQFFDFTDFFPTSAPVGSLQPNAYGIHDMHGNVEEWCSDWYSSEYDAKALIDPMGSPTGTERVARGPGFDAEPLLVRVSCRGHSHPSYRNFNRGFRIVVSR